MWRRSRARRRAALQRMAGVGVPPGRERTAAAIPTLSEGGVPLDPRCLLGGGHPLHRRGSFRVDGVVVTVRPVLPGDAAAVARFMAERTDHTRYLRYHAPVPRLTRRQLAAIVDVDHHLCETLLAHVDDELVGIGQYASGPTGIADLSFVVAEHWQGRGVGGLLADQVIRAACEEGRVGIEATVLAGNRPALRMLHGLPGARTAHHAGATVTVSIPLDQEIEAGAVERSTARMISA